MQASVDIHFRLAFEGDLPQIIKLLSDDVLGSTREGMSEELNQTYLSAFKEITVDSNNELIVGVLDHQIIAVLQMTYIPNLTLMGTKRAQIEGVRVSSAIRGQGIGRKLFDFAFARARERGCKLAQLTTNKTRLDAIRFYEELGFESTHVGMKFSL